ncbi:hypothetical protein AB3662_15280 [Sorangium cellulosum]
MIAHYSSRRQRPGKEKQRRRGAELEPARLALAPAVRSEGERGRKRT